MKNKRFISVTALAALLALGGLVACGEEKPAEPDNPTNETGEKIKLTVAAADGKKKILKDETVQLTASAKDAKVEGITWTSTKPEVASVDANGVVKGLTKGSATIKAEKDGYDAGSISITVDYESIKVSAAGDKKELLIDETVQLSADKTGVTWESSNTAVATVDANGLVKAIKLGDATITAKKDFCNNGTIAIKVVRPAPTKVMQMENALHESADGWYSSTSSGSERGPGVTPVYSKENASGGTCVAYLGAGDKETVTFASSAAVKAEVVFFVGYYSSIENMGDVFDVKFNNLPVSIDGQAYESEDTTNYTYKAISLGEVDLIAGDNVLVLQVKDGASSVPYLDDVNVYAVGTTTITEKPADAPAEFTLNAETIAIEETDTATIVPSIDGCKFATTDDAVCTVSEAGVVTGVKAGSAKITVFKPGYKSMRVSVSVSEKMVAGSYKLEAEAAAKSADTITFRTPSSSSKASGDVTNAWPVGETLTFTFSATEAVERELNLVGRANPGDTGYTYTDVDLSKDIEVTVNGNKLTMEGTISGSTITPYSLGMINLVVGENTIVIKNLELAPTIDYLKIAPKAEAAPQEVIKEWDAKATEATLTKNADTANASYIRINSDYIKASLKDGSTIDRNAEYAADLVNPAEGSILGYKVNVEAAVAKAELWMEAEPNSQSSTWFGAKDNDNSRSQILNADASKYVPAQYRYAIKINGVEVPFTADGGNASGSKQWVKFAIGEFALNAGDNTIEIVGLGGYRAKIYNFKLVKVAE